MSISDQDIVIVSGKISRLPWLSGNEDAITVLLVEDSKTVRTQLRQYIGQLEKVTLIEAATPAGTRRSRRSPPYCGEIFPATKSSSVMVARNLSVW